ncbi:hypothetical protein Pmani_014303 [Petrolisthes manimaculis]|uniref:Ionotropic glutamate receptor C-terminal domain-containing protein n=1 Tax=Petrolisthes manimaculis TaxID=1843537 RepID=A0AAE1PT89_9EUCA|nr:hypothetical protein Pmani_014303 [Petrolisthes manimaculis]
MGIWMLTTLVLTRGYAGTLMSLLAVRHVRQPYHTLMDVLDDPEVIQIWQKNSANEQLLRSVTSGIYREVMNQEELGLLIFRTQGQLSESLTSLVKPDGHVLIDVDVTVRNLIAGIFSQSGRCDYFVSRDGFLPFYGVVASQKGNPLIPAISKRVMQLTSSGIFEYWFEKQIPNSTSCLITPSTVVERVPLSLASLWGVFVMLAAGLTSSVIAFCLENFITYFS